MKFLVKHSCLEKEQTDCIIVGIFYSCKLSSSADYLNTCSNGYINSFIKIGDIQGKIGETMMLYNIPNIVSKRVLLVGCGEENKVNQINLKKIIKHTVNYLKKTSIRDVIYSFSEIHVYKENNIYWLIRLTILSIEKFFYKMIKIHDIFKKNIDLNFIKLNVLDENDLLIAKKSLKHATAISNAITAAKNINNLPPNICTPLYLSNQAKNLLKTYSNHMTVETIDIEHMKKLGMHAYVAVGKGSKNKPFMSVIKYSRNKDNDKIIALVGKGLTFDSGGISIKPAKNMHEMKYDMSGAAAVYGVLMCAAELQLPLTIIGILSGCENMPGGESFRPGDVLTTMSGKTVEIINTDAEGRLVLCDSLTYVERFSPNIVIDVATLTGACVTALGNSISGLFTDDEDLAKRLIRASEETDDKIWRLPLFKEYKDGLSSSIADLSNIGDSAAGAITAACFLSHFAKNYRWAHLDIAGTAWKSKKNEGSTGCPVELLCQFLLNQ